MSGIARLDDVKTTHITFVKPVALEAALWILLAHWHGKGGITTRSLLCTTFILLTSGFTLRGLRRGNLLQGPGVPGSTFVIPEPYIFQVSMVI